MSTSQKNLKKALSSIPRDFQERLIQRYFSLKKDFILGNNSSCGTKAGRFCEVMLRYLQHRFGGSFISFNQPIHNFDEECNRIEKTPKNIAPDGMRLLTPRAMKFVYSMRNKRSFGHEGDDIDAQYIDTITIIRIIDWMMCELIRDLNALSLEEAQALLDAISTKEIPYVWEVQGRKKILSTKMSYLEQTLVLLYANIEAVPSEDLFKWTEYSNYTDYKKRILKSLHNQKLIDYDREIEIVTISPLGIKKVEDEIIPKYFLPLV